MKIKTITDHLEAVAPLVYQESYDNSGLIVGHPQNEVSGILISLDVTEEVVDEALEKKCDLIVAHHPIVFQGLKKLNGKNYVERTVIKAIRNGIAIYAIHTNLDNVHNGVNKQIADHLGLIHTQVLSAKSGILKKLVTFCPMDRAEAVREALFHAGAGHIGNYDSCSFNTEGFGTFRGNDASNPYAGKKEEYHKEAEQRIETIFPGYLEARILGALFQAHPYEEVAYDVYSLDNKHKQVGSGIVGELSEARDEMDFLDFVKKTMQTACVRYTRLMGRKVKRVAVCGGSGSFLLREAIASGADVFITSDYKYHQFFDAEDKIVIADIGHYESEQFTKDLLADLLKEKFPRFAIVLADTNTNPVNYL